MIRRILRFFGLVLLSEHRELEFHFDNLSIEFGDQVDRAYASGLENGWKVCEAMRMDDEIDASIPIFDEEH